MNVTKHWQKLILDPGHYTLLKALDKPKTKKELAEGTGIKLERVTAILKNLKQEKLVEEEVQEGKRVFSRNDLEQKFENTKQELEKVLVGGNRDLVEKGNFEEARTNLSQELPARGDARIKAAKLETAEKLAEIT